MGALVPLTANTFTNGWHGTGYQLHLASKIKKFIASLKQQFTSDPVYGVFEFLHFTLGETKAHQICSWPGHNVYCKSAVPSFSKRPIENWDLDLDNDYDIESSRVAKKKLRIMSTLFFCGHIYRAYNNTFLLSNTCLSWPHKSPKATTCILLLSMTDMLQVHKWVMLWKWLQCIHMPSYQWALWGTTCSLWPCTGQQ